jgi:AcrR family transcriptional regulator
MIMSTITPRKGEATRDRIMASAYDMARREGLQGLSIGSLASEVGMSKSGVFAHFGSLEDLQLALLDSGARRFVEHVFTPALGKPRGTARLAAIVDGWFGWVQLNGGNCVLLAAVSEYDGRVGVLHDAVLRQQTEWRQALARAGAMAVESGELGTDTDVEQLAFEIYSLVLGMNHDAGLFGYDNALRRAQRAFARLIGSYGA